MEPKYRTLETIYEIVKDKPNPHTYQCTPRQIILRQLQEWDIILQHLHLLSEEGFVSIKKIENSVGILITENGMEKIKSFLDRSSTNKTKKDDKNN